MFARKTLFLGECLRAIRWESAGPEESFSGVAPCRAARVPIRTSLR
jgi:hypothetical protein